MVELPWGSNKNSFNKKGAVKKRKGAQRGGHVQGRKDARPTTREAEAGWTGDSTFLQSAMPPKNDNGKKRARKGGNGGMDEPEP